MEHEIISAHRFEDQVYVRRLVIRVTRSLSFHFKSFCSILIHFTKFCLHEKEGEGERFAFSIYY